MTERAPSIRTPDQRLRVFVSSTLKELAPERRAVRGAIEGMRLAPVMFELGARPHPPRDLYRAYLEQSDVFVGIYGDSYGWVAPDEEVSGLEDEYNLLPAGMPRLIYIRESSTRQPRLNDLLARIRHDDLASFTYFRDADELGGFASNDLATLLAERFDAARTPVALETAPPAHTTLRALPMPSTPLIGRDGDLGAIEQQLTGDGARLVSILGSGGMGKSRLAIEAARRLTPSFPGGVSFVPLASVTDEEGVITAIAQAIGVRDSGDTALIEKVATATADRRMLLVLDNFEQVVDAAPAVADLLARSDQLRIIVTSRTRLHVAAERAYELRPLDVPRDGRSSVEAAAASSAVQLFVDRARAMKPDFVLDADNVDAVVGICAAVEGVPLAVELAAARIRVLTPQVILERLDQQLALLVTGARDLPERQRTLRSTIAWSLDLLGDQERSLLEVLGAFAGRTSLDAIEVVWGKIGESTEALALLDTLVDSSLVRQGDRDGHPYFAMLSTVREYALEGLESGGRAGRVREAHAEYYSALARRMRRRLVGDGQREAVRRLADEHDNLRRAAREGRSTPDHLARFAWDLYMYWWIGGHLGEVRTWMEEVLTHDGLAGPTRAIALYFTRAITFWQDPDGLVVPGLRESSALFVEAGEPRGAALADVSLALALLAAPTPDQEGAHAALQHALDLFRGDEDAWGEAMALVSIGRVELLENDLAAALRDFDSSLELASAEHDDLGRAIALHHVGWADLMLGDAAAADGRFTESLEASVRLDHTEGIAYGLEGLSATAAMRGDVGRAGTLAGAALALRRRTGLFNLPTFSFHDLYLGGLRDSGAGDALQQALTTGEALDADAAVAAAMAHGAGATDA